MVTYEVNGRTFYIDGRLQKYLDTKVIPALQKKDEDCVMLVDGEERCLTGDTVIRTNRASLGRKHNIKWMFNQYHKNPDQLSMFKQWNLNIPTFVRSYNGKTIQLHEIKDVVYSGKKKVWKLLLENEMHITATEDHKIMTNNGFIELYKLDINKDLVMCDTPNSLKNLDRVIKHMHRDINMKVDFHPSYLKRKQRIKVQQLIYEANLNNLSLHDFIDILLSKPDVAKILKYINTEVECVHHKDFNHYNNSLDNLELIKVEEHLKLHARDSYSNFNQGVPNFIKISSITYFGIEDTYDIVCEEPNHNFSANGIIVHNSGKSVFAMGLGNYVSFKLGSKYDITNITLAPEEFRTKVMGSKVKETAIYDEAHRGMASSRSLSEINNLLKDLMMEMGQKNLFVIIVLPSFFLLDKYPALLRSKGLFHIYKRRGQRGFWCFFNRKNKIKLYQKGKKELNYNCMKWPKARGRFFDQYPIDEQVYRQKKSDSFTEKKRTTKGEAWKEQRDLLVHILSKELHFGETNLAKLLKRYSFPLEHTVIGEILAKYRETVVKEDPVTA